MSCTRLTRREWFGCTAKAAAGLYLARPRWVLASRAPAAPVAIAGCRSYGSELLPAMERMFDQLGGLGRLVKGKTVAIKLNLTGSPTYRMGYVPLGLAQWVHPRVVSATVHCLARAGAHRIRLLESPWATTESLEEFIWQANWDPQEILSAGPRVEFENTNYLGRGKRYSRLWVPNGGHMFKAFDLNHSYEDCDVFVSLAKLKEHLTAGVTLSMKNCFGITPCTIYGVGSGEEEPSLEPQGGRAPFHDGSRQPSRSALPENDPKSPREGGYRVPRIVADLVAARPIQLAIIDGIETMAGGEGPWVPGGQAVKPGIMVAGTNPVCTDAVATALMNFDPMGDRGTPPFETCDSTLRLGEEHGIGTRDLKRIEVVGGRIGALKFDFAELRLQRQRSRQNQSSS
ncbi:MAG: DUF362 domain-containing protein [Acidobacteriota bacterium]